VGAVLLVAAGIVGWRVLAPAEVLHPAADPYPVAATPPAGVTGRSADAPLIVQGRVRVYAAARTVRAEAPVDAPKTGTPRWSYRRWPEQLSGLLAVGRTVITHWSDGTLVALDAGTGTVTWRSPGPAAGGYDGLRTGARTVWSPPGLHTAGPTLLVSGGTDLVALDTATGVRRWQAELPPDCGTEGFTTVGGRYVCTATGASYDTRTGRPAPVAGAPGPVTPLGCGDALSDCAGLRDSAGRGWLTGTTLRRVPALDGAGSTLAAGLVISAPGTELTARSPVTGTEAWRWTAPAGDTVQVLGAEPAGGAATSVGGGTGVVHLLTGRRELITLDADSGVERSRFVLAYRTEKEVGWAVGAVRVADGFVAVERLAVPPVPEGDDAYYFSELTVLVAAT
jgi:outer membrane protein assembly factor BamB